MDDKERKKIITKEFLKTFPNKKIKDIEKFNEGLVSEVYKIKTFNPKEDYAFKIFKLKNLENLKKNNLILNYLENYNIPSIKIYLEKECKDFGFVIMECAKGEVLSSFFKESSPQTQKKILFNSGKILHQIHNLEIPNFWIHKKHEIKTIQEYRDWTNLRVKKYLRFAKENLTQKQIDFLTKEFKKLKQLMLKDFDIVPLHWDYHFSNINGTKDGDITAVFDFDNAMKGHNLSDIGQSLYWYISFYKTNKNFNYFLKGYNQDFSKNDKKMIWQHFLLFLLAVIRNNWEKERLQWLIKEHLEILNDCIDNKYNKYFI